MQALVAVADELHFGRAAERLGMAQPQLSELIRRVEDQAGFLAFVRRPQVTVTPGGKVLVRMARRVLAEVAAETTRARAIASGKAGIVRVGFSAPSMLTGLPKTLRRFAEDHPDVVVELVEYTSAPLGEELEAGRCDLIVTRQPQPTARAQTVRIEPDHVLLALPDGHQAIRQHVRLAQVADENFIFFRRSAAPAYYDRLMAACRTAGIQPRVVLEVDSWVATFALVGAGWGLSFATETASRLGFPGVTFCELGDEEVDASFWLAWIPAQTSAAAERLCAALQSVDEASPPSIGCH